MPACRTDQASISARINWVCQVLFASTFLVVAGTVLAVMARQFRPAVVNEWACEAPRSIQIPNMQVALQPFRVGLGSKQLGSPIIYVDLSNLSVTDADLRELARCAPQLERLILFKANISDESLSEIRQMPRLTVLNLAGTQITDSGLEHLARLTSLETLSLSDTPITDEGLKHLGGLNRLQTLSLQNTAITDAGLESLRQLPQLQRLDIYGTKTSRHGVQQIMEQLTSRARVRCSPHTYSPEKREAVNTSLP
jgi:hypothetical protein